MIPRVSQTSRTSSCDLGLFNLNSMFGTSNNTDGDEFAIGQNFIRSYNATYKYAISQGNGDITLSIYIGNAPEGSTLDI